MLTKHLPTHAAALRLLLASAAFLLVFPAPTRSQEGWGLVGSCGLERVNGAGSKLTSLVFLDDRRGVVVGNAGLVRITRNGGITWSKPQFEKPYTSGISDNVQRVSASGNNLLLVSYTLVMHSRNGGGKWSVLNVPAHPAYEKEFGRGVSTYFYDASVVGGDAWVLGAVYDTSGKLFKGSFILHYNIAKERPTFTMKRLVPLEQGTEFLQVFFIDRNNGWVVGSKGGILMSNDGGGDWRSPVMPIGQVEAAPRPGGRMGATATDAMQGPRQIKPKLYSVYFIDNDRGWVVGENSATYYTNNGGDNWKQGRVKINNAAGKKATLTQVQFIDERRGWAVGSAGTFIRTVDGGKNWVPELLPKSVTQTLYTVHMMSDSAGWAAGAGDMLLHYDALYPVSEENENFKRRKRAPGRANDNR